MTPISKNFVMNWSFSDVSNWKKGEWTLSPVEEFFGLKWLQLIYKRITVVRGTTHFGALCGILDLFTEEKRQITINAEISVVSPSTKTMLSRYGSQVLGGTPDEDKPKDGFGWLEFTEWENLVDNFSRDGRIYVRVRVEIVSMTGVYGPDLRSFDESMKDVSDVVLVVDGKKFYVAKLYLATHSMFFKRLLLGNFEEAKQSEVKLGGVDADDFQNFLELLYGEDSINDKTIDGMLLLGDMYDTPMAMKKCEQFLMRKSKKTRRRKIQMAIRYNLKKLQKQCISVIKTEGDLMEVRPEGMQILDPEEFLAIIQLLKNSKQ